MNSDKLKIICKICSHNYTAMELHTYNVTLNEYQQGFGCPRCALRDSKINMKQLEDVVVTRKGKIVNSNIVCSNGHKFSKFINLSYEWCRTCNIEVKDEFVKLLEKNSDIQSGEYISDKYWRISYSKTGGEINISNILTRLNYPFLCEISIKDLPRRRYDFYLKIGNKEILIENDENYHFLPDSTSLTRKYDIFKTYIGLQAGYNIIRIDYTYEEKLDSFLDNTFKTILSETTPNIYLTNKNIYSWLLPPKKDEMEKFILEDDNSKIMPTEDELCSVS